MLVAFLADHDDPMAALLGALPLALGTGTGSELRRPLGISILGGLIVSQMLTLFTTPVIYLYMDRLGLPFARHKSVSAIAAIRPDLGHLRSAILPRSEPSSIAASAFCRRIRCTYKCVQRATKLPTRARICRAIFHKSAAQ